MIKKLRWRALVLLSIILLPQVATAQVQEYHVELKSINSLIEKDVRESFSYSGLAAFYNGVSVYVVDASGIKRLGADIISLNSEQSLAVIGHYKVLILDDFPLGVSFDQDKLLWHKPDASHTDFNAGNVHVRLLPKSELMQLSAPFHQLKYAHLWAPFRVLCLGIEAILLWLNSSHSLGWGLSIILLSLLFKVFILPANILLTRVQRNVSHTQARLAPKLENIKTNFSGEEAHQKFMAAHKQQGVTPFYTLKPLLLTLIPVPFLIAIFNVLGELYLIAGHGFLWVEDLAYPDNIYGLGIHIPLLGNSINLLPILMTLLTILAALFHQNKIISQNDLRKQKLNLYLMACGFFVLFYPFPAAMVLYWLFANIWQLIQQRFIRV